MNDILDKLKKRIKSNGHIIGIASGSGLTSKYSTMSGADIVLALSAGIFRKMGRSSLASYMCYSNSNEVVMNFGTRELMPLIKNTPIFFGINATDPTIKLKEYLMEIKEQGFVGINNFPTVGLIDGSFRDKLEEEGISYKKEVEAIKIASEIGLMSIAFVFNEEQAREMINAGAEIICVHLGLTCGGFMGAAKVLSLEVAKQLANRVFEVCDKMNPNIIKLVFGGPIKTPIDAQFFYQNTSCQGFIGGSCFERIPVEKAIIDTTKAFDNVGKYDEDKAILKELNNGSKEDCVEYVKKYIHDFYMKPIYIRELSESIHISSSYLSTKFKKEVGISFTEYLVTFRINKACEILLNKSIPIKTVANMVAYDDYSQFSKIFKKYTGKTPKEYREQF